MNATTCIPYPRESLLPAKAPNQPLKSGESDVSGNQLSTESASKPVPSSAANKNIQLKSNSVRSDAFLSFWLSLVLLLTFL